MNYLKAKYISFYEVDTFWSKNYIEVETKIFVKI